MLAARIPFQPLRLTQVLVLVAVWPSIVAAQPVERPSAPKLLPVDTLVYARVADMPDLIARFQETMLGRISQDEQVRPLLNHLWGSAIKAAEQLEEQLGASLQDLVAIPQGEVCLAVVAPPEGRPAVVLLLDAKDRMPVVQRIIDRMESRLLEDGAVGSIERVNETELVVHQLPGNRQRQVVYVQRDGTLLVCTDLSVAQAMIAAWDGEGPATLADNADFTAIMRRCSEEDAAPQITFFVDAVELTRRIGRGSLPGQTLIALLPALGLDGVRGIGGSIAFAPAQYDSLAHLHLLLDSPRKGIPEMLALGSGDLTPESWVPADAVTYTSLHWDIPTSYAALNSLYDAIRGQGALQRDMDRRLSDPLGIDFREDFLEALTGRMTHVGWMVKPARLNSRGNLVGLELKDAAAFRATWLRVTEKFQNQLQRKALASTEYWEFAVRQPSPDEAQRPLLRRPDPAVAIVGDYLLISDSTDLLRHAIATKGEASASLAEELDFKLIASKIRSQNGGENPGVLSFNRPEESLRLVYELAAAETTRERLASQAENNRLFGALDSALRETQLPPFSVLARYLAPGGSLLTNDETGLHYTRFTLRRK